MEYLYIEQTKTRIELHAKEEDWSWEIGGKRYGIDPAIERLLAFYINTYREGKFLELARLNLPKKAAATLSPQLIKSTFIKGHAVKTINDYNRSMIPTYADHENGLWVYGDGRTWSFWIADFEEETLLRQFRSAKGDGWRRCLQTLNGFAKRQGFQIDGQTLEAALDCFFEQHGVRPETVRDEERQYYIKEREAGRNPTKNDPNSISNIGSVVLCVLMACLMALYWGMTFYGENIGMFLAPIGIHVLAVKFNAAGSSNMRKATARCYLLLFTASVITSILAIIYKWGYEPGLFNDSPDTEIAGVFSLFFSSVSLFISHLIYCDTDTPGKPGGVDAFLRWYAGKMNRRMW